MRDLSKLPEGLPIPTDDGACDHLKNISLPAISLRSTSDRFIDLGKLQQPTVIFFYPRTGEPTKPAPADWDLIPGARGCTPQSCGFRDLHGEFKSLGYQVFGASSQSTEYQKEFVSLNHIPFDILSDEKFELTDALNLPTFLFNGTKLIKRMTWVVSNGKIDHFFYPVFPPNENASRVLEWLRTQNH
jgi:peroxiredoxin